MHCQHAHVVAVAQCKLKRGMPTTLRIIPLAGTRHNGKLKQAGEAKNNKEKDGEPRHAERYERVDPLSRVNECSQTEGGQGSVVGKGMNTQGDGNGRLATNIATRRQEIKRERHRTRKRKADACTLSVALHAEQRSDTETESYVKRCRRKQNQSKENRGN